MRMIFDFIRLSGAFLLGAITGAVAIIWPVWCRYTEIEYQNCALRRKLRLYEDQEIECERKVA
jgi:hypothetical protein